MRKIRRSTGWLVLLGVIGLVAALFIAANTTMDGPTYPEPTQPDPKIAGRIERSLETQPGVARATVTMKVQCIDMCKGSVPEFVADIELTDDVTASQVVRIDRSVARQFPADLPSPWTFTHGRARFSLHSPESGGLFTPVGMNRATLLPLSEAAAGAFLTAARANSDTEARWEPEEETHATATPATAEPGILTLTSRVTTSECAHLDSYVGGSVAALRSARQAGVHAALQFTCDPFVSGTVAIGPGTKATGWSKVATSLSALKAGAEAQDPQRRNAIHLYAEDAETVLTVHPSPGTQLTDEARAQGQATLAVLDALGALAPRLDTGDDAPR